MATFSLSITATGNRGRETWEDSHPSQRTVGNSDGDEQVDLRQVVITAVIYVVTGAEVPGIDDGDRRDARSVLRPALLFVRGGKHDLAHLTVEHPHQSVQQDPRPHSTTARRFLQRHGIKSSESDEAFVTVKLFE